MSSEQEMHIYIYINAANWDIVYVPEPHPYSSYTRYNIIHNTRAQSKLDLCYECSTNDKLHDLPEIPFHAVADDKHYPSNSRQSNERHDHLHILYLLQATSSSYHHNLI